MKPKLIHQEAMDYSFKAKQALDENNHSKAFGLYKKAAVLESQVAEFYLNRTDLEPTRSVIIRSAAFLNLKAGLIAEAKKFIFFGLLYIDNKSIVNQLNNALEIAVSLDTLDPESASREFNYINLLRQKSMHYSIEPANLLYGHSVSLEMVKDFSDYFLKSLKAFAFAKFKDILSFSEDIESRLQKEISKMINPLVTSSSYGSFKFSIANDFLPRGEDQDVLALKSTIIESYHYQIFTNPLSDDEIVKIKEDFSEEEVNAIFRPLIKIKSNSSPYKISYFDAENFNKKYAKPIVNKQRKQLLSIKTLTTEDIGELESLIVHKRGIQSGKITKKTIFKEDLKSYETDIRTNSIELSEGGNFLLAEEILISMNFNSDKGFTFAFDDLELEYTDIEYSKALNGFYLMLYSTLVELANKTEFTFEEEKFRNIASRLVGNFDSLKKK